jgi:phospholipase/carboxylesterase
VSALFRGRGRLEEGARAAAEGRLLARPRVVESQAAAGLHKLGLCDSRDGLVYVHEGYDVSARPAPLALMLHGAGGDAVQGISLLRSFADASGLILLAPDARRATWDVVNGGYGPDVSFIDGALEQTFARYSVDASRVAVGGFSDGASYALCLGAANGDLFTHVLAFSPGFMAPPRLVGRPRIFVSHGTRDRVLPVDRCGRRVVAQAKGAGYEVEYMEFEGPHAVPREAARAGVEWFMK